MHKTAVGTFFIALVLGASSTASAQQTLSVDVLESYGDLALQGEGIGCFDVLAAVRLQTELAGGSISEQTRQAFSSGSCVVATSDINLVDAKKIEIETATLVRGDISDTEVTVYFPEELLTVNASDADTASLTAIASDLRRRVGEMQKCSDERDALDARILDFNMRVDAFMAAKEEEGAATGSRLKENNTASVSSVKLDDAGNKALRQESLALQSEAKDHKQRCGAYEAGITLDQDYMSFYRATAAARS